jgi:hypothetical protein
MPNNIRCEKLDISFAYAILFTRETRSAHKGTAAVPLIPGSFCRNQLHVFKQPSPKQN